MTLEIIQSDVAVVGKLDANGKFKIRQILKGIGITPAVGETIDVPELESDSVWLATGIKSVETGEITWAAYARLNSSRLRYLLGALENLSEESHDADLAYFFPFLTDPDDEVSDDAYYQFAKSDYADLQKVESHLDRDVLVKLAKSSETSPHLRTLAFTLLNICGKPEDAGIPKAFMERNDAALLRNLDAAIACYISLGGEPALDDAVKRFVLDDQAAYPATFATIKAIRFHLQDEDRIPRARLFSALHQMLNKPELADVVIPDLIQWKDWTAQDNVVKLLDAKFEPWVRAAAAKYVLANPNSGPELDKLRAKAPEAFRQVELGSTVPTEITKPTKSSRNISNQLLMSWLTSPMFLAPLIAVLICGAVLFTIRKFV